MKMNSMKPNKITVLEELQRVYSHYDDNIQLILHQYVLYEDNVLFEDNIRIYMIYEMHI